ncbi:MAG: class II aldolase/adducin family protein [Bacteroidia bacterium]
MHHTYQAPRRQLAQMIARIYQGGMTTTSGGNLSIRDGDTIWITPSAVDKGALTPRDMVQVLPDGRWEGPHKPSSEYPFHQAIYQQRPDIGAIVHAHPPGLVSFSIVRQIPDTNVIPQARHICGRVGYAPYRLPGSAELGASIASQFALSYDSVIMENHGTVVGGTDLSEAYQRLETLEFCARTLIRAHQIDRPYPLSERQIDDYEAHMPQMDTFEHLRPDTLEKEQRHEICHIIHRAIRQRLMISTYGTVSLRLRGSDFLITPYGTDRAMLQPQDLVLVRDRQQEHGKHASRATLLHADIYEAHPEIHCIISTQSPHATAFAVAGRSIDTRTIPESYILLKDIPVLPFGSQYAGEGIVPRVISHETPIALIQNEALLVSGRSLLEAFDRLEVAEFSACALIDSMALGRMVPIDEAGIEDLRRKFLS